MAIWKDDQSAQPPPPPRSRLAEFIYRIRQDLKQQGEDPDFALEPQELGNGDYLTVGALVYHIIWS